MVCLLGNLIAYSVCLSLKKTESIALDKRRYPNKNICFGYSLGVPKTYVSMEKNIDIFQLEISTL